ncbi:MAG: hypothetical protein AAF555_06945 [Verrucomicrobiota bacterium]
MGWILSGCRHRLTPRDFAFLQTILAADAEPEPWQRFFREEQALAEILDDERLFRALGDHPFSLQISPQLYFYLLVRHFLREAGIEDRDVADFVAAVLADRIGSPAGAALTGIPGGWTHTTDFLALLSGAGEERRFEIYLAAGNQFLILTGLFPNYLRRRRDRAGAPGVRYYEGFARQAYQALGQHRLADPPTRQVLGRLVNSLTETRQSLNRMAENCLFLEDARDGSPSPPSS